MHGLVVDHLAQYVVPMGARRPLAAQRGVRWSCQRTRTQHIAATLSPILLQLICISNMCSAFTAAKAWQPPRRVVVSLQPTARFMTIAYT